MATLTLATATLATPNQATPNQTSLAQQQPPPALGAAAPPEIFERFQISDQPRSLRATGTITNGTHPERFGHFATFDVNVDFTFDPSRGESSVVVRSGTDEDSQVLSYFIRRGRIFQVDDEGIEVPATHLGDLSPATVAALHPDIVLQAMKERRDAVRRLAEDVFLFAWNDELWTVALNRGGQVSSLHRLLFDDVFGDGEETIRFGISAAGAPEVLVERMDRSIARLELGPSTIRAVTPLPEGEPARDRALLIAPEDVQVSELGPGVFALDLVPLNRRMFVAEFSDHLVVLEGAHNSRCTSAVADVLEKRFPTKPVRYFAFSHIHPQYVGGLRTWVESGATILLPPATVPLVEQIAQSEHSLRPDELSRRPRELTHEVFGQSHRMADDENELLIQWVDSDHTDDYLVFYFPRSGLLLSGDLMFFREGKPFAGRSLNLCQAVEHMGIDVRDVYVSWPLTGYGTSHHVVGDDFRTKCRESM